MPRRRPVVRFMKPTKGSHQASTIPSNPRTSSDEWSDASDPTRAAEDDTDVDETYLFNPAMPTLAQNSTIPSLFTNPPFLKDPLTTVTSEAQDAVVEQCLPFMSGAPVADDEDDADPETLTPNARGVPRLLRQKHVEFLEGALGKLPAGFMGMDATRPWMLYWALNGLMLLGEDISVYRERVIYTLAPMQNPDGGFGGGHGQMSHCASTYAAVLSLALVGGEDAYDMIDREAMWRFYARVKQPDGGFALCVGGEEDVRGAYCAMVVITLLDLPLLLPADAPAQDGADATFLTGLPEYLASCQTYEGGISASPGREAHGGYAFCAMACLSLIDVPHRILPQYLDMATLTSWLSARQYSPEGGFSGRTNKLVDGCYSHWVGGCFPILEAALTGPTSGSSDNAQNVSRSLYSREGLIRYILCCCQQEIGGMRDKPEKPADSYHTSYILSGLSSAQNKYATIYTPSQKGEETSPLSAAFHWSVTELPSTPEHSLNSDSEGVDGGLFGPEDRVGVVHPIFVMPWGVGEAMRKYYEGKRGV
ncbi:MAG: hypothetical protein M4579_005375 [Chaenotheca gracillima]|nr:MAG: hypothetical protein M4579_005375 [Chaenotheca gracillima]